LWGKKKLNKGRGKPTLIYGLAETVTISMKPKKVKPAVVVESKPDVMKSVSKYLSDEDLKFLVDENGALIV
jgi:hypothetical protein